MTHSMTPKADLTDTLIKRLSLMPIVAQRRRPDFTNQQSAAPGGRQAVGGSASSTAVRAGSATDTLGTFVWSGTFGSSGVFGPMGSLWYGGQAEMSGDVCGYARKSS